MSRSNNYEKQSSEKEAGPWLKEMPAMRYHARHDKKIRARILQAMLPRGSIGHWLQKIWVKDMRHDMVSDVMYTLNNADRFGKRDCSVPASNVVKEALKILQEEGYIGSFELVDDGKSGTFRVEMIGKINNSRAIRPRFSSRSNNYEKWERRYLPSRDIGVLIVSTASGMMTQKKARDAGIGGKLLDYVY